MLAWHSGASILLPFSEKKRKTRAPRLAIQHMDISGDIMVFVAGDYSELA
jgi:hypothetical protein